MFKSNWIVYSVAIVISAFLLWLWYFLSFNLIDNPLDLVLSILWWVLVAVAILVIRNREKVRREAVNTCFVAPMKIYNSETGLQDMEAEESRVERIQSILEGLKYSFDMEPYPGEDDENGEATRKVDFVYVVRTKNFKVENKDQEDEQITWEGEVAIPSRPDDDPKPFASKQELMAIIEPLLAA